MGEHVFREDTHLVGGEFGLRAQIDEAGFLNVYTWKPHVKVQVVRMSRDEALGLAALIQRAWPLDALSEIDAD